MSTPQIPFTVHNPLISFRDKLIPITYEPNKYVNSTTNTLTHNFLPRNMILLEMQYNAGVTV
jgi:hypothetical protein